MIQALEIRRLDGTTRDVDATELPLALGGAGADIEIAGVSGTEPTAWIGLSDGDLFVQAVDGGERILCNGGPVRSSQWLHDGDELRVGATRIEVDITDFPLLAAAI